MKSKILIKLFVIFVIVALSLTLVACVEKDYDDDGNPIEPPTTTPTKCTHNYNLVETNATCTQTGTKTYTCKLCGHSYSETSSMQELNANEVYEKSKKSIGEIITYKSNGAELALGTGFVYSADGQIITNYHVIENAYSAKITIDGTNYTVSKVLAYNKDYDLAVLKITASNLLPVNICYSKHSVGETVYAFGSSKGLTSTFSQGIITYASRDVDGVECVQHDAAISSGNSGGPLINKYGEVIGVNTWTISNSQNLNFAVSVREIKELTYGTPLSIAEFYNKECDPFIKLKNYAISEGTYSSGRYSLKLGSSYSNDYSYQYVRYVVYDVEYEEVELQLFMTGSSADHLVVIEIDEIDGIYDWSYVDDSNYYMTGTLYARTFDNDTLLGYSYNTITNSSLRNTIRELSSSMVSLLCFYLDDDLSEVGVTANDLYFTYY